MVIQGKSQISFPGVLFSSAHAHVSFFRLCFSSAEQRSSLPHVNSWLHIHSPREDCRERLPLTSEGPTLLRVGQSCYGFIHSSSHHEDNTWSKQQVQIGPCHNASTFFSKLASFLPACLSVLADEGQMLRSDDSIREKSETITLVADVLLALKSTAKTLLLLFSWWMARKFKI